MKGDVLNLIFFLMGNPICECRQGDVELEKGN